MFRVILVGALLSGAVLSWSAATLDALLIFSGVALMSAGLLLSERRGGQSSMSPDVRSAVVGLVCLLCAVAFLLALTGTMSLSGIRETLVASYQPPRAELRVGRVSMIGIAASVLLLGAAAPAVGLAPFHSGQVTALENARSWQAVAVLLLLRLQGLALLVRTLDAVSAGSEAAVPIVTGLAGAGTCLASAALVHRAQSLRSVAGCLWLASGGLAVAAYSLGAGSPAASPVYRVAGFPPAAAIALVMTLSGALVCVSLLALDERLTGSGQLPGGSRRLGHFDELIGLGRQAPVTAFLLTVTLLSCLPIPPSPMFWGLLVTGGRAFVPGIDFDGRQQAVAGAVPILTLLAAGAALLRIAARLILPVGLMFHQEPLRRLEPASGKTPLIVSAVCVSLLLLAGLLPTVLFSSVSFFAASP